MADMYEVLADRDKYHDLSEYFGEQESYLDFEGMTGSKEVLEALPEGIYWDNDLHRDLVLHYVHQTIDQGGVTPSEENIWEVWAAFGMLMNLRWISTAYRKVE